MFILIALIVFYVAYGIIGIFVFFVNDELPEGTKMNLQYAFFGCLFFVYLISSYNGVVMIISDRRLRRFFKRNVLRRV